MTTRKRKVKTQDIPLENLPDRPAKKRGGYNVKSEVHRLRHENTAMRELIKALL